MTSKAKHWTRKRIAGHVAFHVIGILITNAVIINIVRSKLPYDQQIGFIDSTPIDVIKDLKLVETEQSEALAGLADASPFVEIDPFDEDAKSWTQFFSQMGGEGLLIFDANGDDLLDVYLCQDGQNWTRPTDVNGVLADQPRAMANMLYLHQGNDAEGNPTYKSVGELARANETYVEEELLVEGYLFNRKTTEDSKQRPGRASYVAVAADLNADGLQDLIVGNVTEGMFWSSDQTSRVLQQFVDPIGRQSRKAKLPLTPFGKHLIQYEPRSGLDVQRKSSRGLEYEAANSLYINLGDRDGDGIPEWEDASRSAGIEGFRPTSSFSVADFDLDGDLDIYTANHMDHDYAVGGATQLAGGVNSLYMNQLAETGKLEFIERAGESDVDGTYDAGYPAPDYYRLRRFPFIPVEYSFMLIKMEPYQPGFLEIDGVEAEHAQISWASVAQDVNLDGLPDLWVANDFGYLRLYLNRDGVHFDRVEHARSTRSGYWMSFAPADFNGDLAEDLFVGNLGGSVMNNATVPYTPMDLFDPVMLTATISAQFLADKHDSTHAVVDGADWNRELPLGVSHSSILPPDVAIPHNYRREAYDRRIPEGRFEVDTLDPYEFAWGSTAFDMQNDGMMDLYWIGGLYGRGGGLFAVTGTAPGRLLVNVTSDPAEARFADQTAEHHLFNIQELQYDRLQSEGYIWRKSPSQNWNKRDRVTSLDRSTWISQGQHIQERVTNQDLIQTSELGRAAMAADLNNDGFLDILVRNKGGYDSRRSDAVNLKARVGERVSVLPAHDNNYPTPTNFEPGATRVFINSYSENHWLKVRLVDDTPGALNRDAIGARVIINGKALRVKRAGDGSFGSSALTDLAFGLGQDSAHVVEIHWPDRDRTVTRLDLNDVHDRTITISKTRGLLS